MATLGTNFPYTLPPISNVSPFTYRDGATYLEILNGLKDYINNNLRTEFNEGFNELLVDFQAGITNAETTITDLSEAWTEQYDAFIANFTNEIALLNAAAVAGMVNTPGSVKTALVALIDAEIEDELTAANTYTDTKFTEAGTNLASAVTTLNTTIDGVETDYAAADALRIPLTQRGAVNGVATLDGTGKVPSGQLPPQVTSITGTYAGRPAATAYSVGTTYYATDAQETYRTDGAVWAVVGQGGNEIGYTGLDGSVPQFNTTSETYVAVPNLTMNITPGERPINVRFEVWAAISTPAVAQYAIFVDGIMFREFAFRGSAGDVWETFTGESVVRNLAPGGSNIITLRVKTSAGTTSRTSGAPYIQAVTK